MEYGIMEYHGVISLIRMDCWGCQWSLVAVVPLYVSVSHTGADSVACIQLWSLHEQCHQLRGWGVVYLLYLLACALQYRYLNTTGCCMC
jgi:hypothetical protein